MPIHCHPDAFCIQRGGTRWLGHIPTRGAGTAWRLLSGVLDVPPLRVQAGVGLRRPPPASPPAWQRAAVVMASGYCFGHDRKAVIP